MKTILLLLALAISVHAQAGVLQTFGSGAPSGYCHNASYVDKGTGISYKCDEATHAWQPDTATFNMGVSGGVGDMLKANNLSDLISASTARSNLGLGTLATQNGTFSGTSSGTNTGDQSLSGLALTDLSNVNGTVTANAGSGTFTNQQSNVTLDYDTGAGTQNLTLWGFGLPASGGAVAGGTVANPLRIDPTGTTTQPVSLASVPSHPVTNAGTFAVQVTSMPSTPVTGVFFQATQPVSGTFWQATQPISAAALPLPSGAATSAKQDSQTTLLGGGLPLALVGGRLDVNIGNAPNVSVTNTPAVNQNGTWTDRIVGNAGAAIDAANNTAAPANVIATGHETATQGTTQPTAATAGNVRRPVESTDGAQYVRLGGPVTWSAGLDAVGATLTQVQAAPAAGLKLYVTDIVAQSTTAVAGQFLLRYGTGTNCGTGTVSLLPSAATVVRLGYPPNTVAPLVIKFASPIAVPVAANALCVLGVTTNTLSIQINGYTAP